ncbi:MAG: hypothetical protein HKN80_01845, partial [Acidimicrobiia bacterium]|nr:hypothetical protein [Acidimicrobiia bacterium]
MWISPSRRLRRYPISRGAADQDPTNSSHQTGTRAVKAAQTGESASARGSFSKRHRPESIRRGPVATRVEEGKTEDLKAARSGTGRGLVIERRFTKDGQSPYDTVEWSFRDSRITNPDGSIVFEMLGAEIPSGWSQVAADIMVSKYFRKAGVPQVDAKGKPILDEDGNRVTGSETSARQVIGRLAETWRHWGEEHGYFADEQSAQIFEDELAYMLVHQMAAPNSPQ